MTKMTIKQKCLALGISVPSYYARIRNGISPEQALSAPSMRKNIIVFESDFQSRRIKQIAEKRIKRANNAKTNQNTSKSTSSISNRQRYTPLKRAISKPESLPSKIKEYACNNDCFDKACGGYTAVILNNAKNGEFKYQIYSTRTQNKLYTNDVKRFIEGIIKICGPLGRAGIEVIGR